MLCARHTRNSTALGYGRLGTRAALGAVLLVVALLVAVFVARRYDIKYVYDYSSSDLEFRFRVASLWAGQPGSFVIWALWGLIVAQFLVRRTRHAEPYVLSVFMFIQAGLLFFMLIINPFAPNIDPTTGAALVPADGKGLNELLHNFSFNGWRVTPQGKGTLDMTVTRGNETFNAMPMLYYNPRMGATMATPSVKSELLQDLYISSQEYEPPNDRNTAQLVVNDKKAIGPYTIIFLDFDASQAHASGSGDIGARLRVSYQGQDTIVTPIVRLVANETDPTKAFQRIAATLPGGKEVIFQDFDPVQRWAFIRVNGLNLPVDPAKAVVTVSLKPGILLVWLGIAIGVLGGLIALVRRTLEGQARLAGRSARLPRGLVGLVRFAGDK